MFSTPNQQKRSHDYGSSQQGWGGSDGAGDGGSERKKKRKSRWGAEDVQDKTVIPGMPTIIPCNLSKEQERQYLLHLQIEEISRRLRTGDLGIPPNPEDRSPSPEPIYNNEGKRLNTREYRTRKKLEEDRHRLVQEAMALNTDYKPPADYKPPVIRVNDKVMIPQEEHPDINFVGLLIGPRGNTLKTLEKETGAKIIIRGKGSVKDGKIGRKDGQPLPGEDEPLHAYVTANNPENVKKAVEKIKGIIKESVEVPEGQNDLRKQQLRELALLNGTLRENDGLAKLKQLQQAQTIVTNTIICSNCGGAGHLSKDCKQSRPGDTFRNMMQDNTTDKAKMDSEYMSLMAELGEGPPPQKSNNSMLPTNRPPLHQNQPHVQNRFNQPPPNPMGGFNSFPNPQNRPPPPSMMGMNNARGPMSHPPMFQQQMQHGMQGMQHHNQMQPPQQMQQMQQGGMHPFQPQGSAPQPVAPPNTLASQYQPNMQMSAPAGVGPVPPPNSMNITAPVPPPAWSTASGSHINSNPTQALSMGVPPPPTTIMAAAPPPPPPSSNQPTTTIANMPWLQQGAVPPPPPSSQGTWQTAPPPPPASMSMPWQQVPPPSMQSIPNPVAPPPPPPSSGQGFNMPPPPPGPGGYDPNQMSGVNPLLVAPPPPPPN